MELYINAHNAIRLFILLAFIVLGVTYGLLVPPFENLDEVEHFEVVRYIAATGRLPVHGRPDGERYHYRQEASQPPLYHLLAAGLVRLASLPTEPPTLRPNPRVACGPHVANLYDNRAVLYHNPNAEAFPWRGALLTLHVLRLWSTLLQVGTVIGSYALARRAFPRSPTVALLAMSIVAFNPQFIFVASDVSNDNLVTPLAVGALYLLLRIWQDGPTAGSVAGVGLLTGLAGLAKLSGWLLLPLALLVIAAQTVTGRIPRRTLLLSGLLLIAIPALTSAWWFWRNWRLYGDLTALTPMLALVGRRDSPIHPLYETRLMFLSFWGQIPCSFYPATFYVPYAVLVTWGFLGLGAAWRRLRTGERAAVGLFALWFALVLVAWLRWDILTPAPRGRLLFPALPAVAALLALGIGAGYRRPVVCLLFVLAVVALFILSAFFSPPRRYPAPAAVSPEHPLDARLGDSIHLRGYDLALDTRPLALDTTLYWQSAAPLAEDYVLALQLISPRPGDTTLRLNYNSWPGRGNYPTSAWRPGELIADRYRLSLDDPSDHPTQAWNLALALYRQETGERLPVYLDDRPAGDMLIVEMMRVPGRSPDCPAAARLTPAPDFAAAVALTHAWVVTDTAGGTLSLCWESRRPLSDDYTVFVHLLDGDGNLIATGDGPPMDGAFPTSLWRPGDVILDVHHLTGTLTSAQIAVGLYRPSDGERLPAFLDGQPVADASVTVWP